MLLYEHSITEIFFMFFVFCNYGWIQESIIESTYHHRLINRGFLKGPYIPIYGVGSLLLLTICLPFKFNGFIVYFVGMICCTMLEFFVGWLMETAFHKQFWDYSMLKFTFKNRISLISSLFWGLMALLMVYLLSWVMDLLVGVLNPTFILIYDIVMGTAMIIDIIVTVIRQTAAKKKYQQSLKEQSEKEAGENIVNEEAVK